MATVTGYTSTKIEDMLSGFPALEASQIDLNNRLGELDVRLGENDAKLLDLNTVTLPALRADLDANDLLLADLNDVTIPNLEANLAQNDLALTNLNTVDLPSLDARLESNTDSLLEMSAEVLSIRSPEKVMNGGFEIDFVYWSEDPNVILNLEHVYEGDQAAEWLDSATIEQAPIPVEEGQIWRFEHWYKTGVAWTGSAANIPQRFDSAGVLIGDVPGAVSVTQTETWTLLTFDWTVDAVTKFINPARMVVTLTAGESLYADNFRCYDVTSQLQLDDQLAQLDAELAAADASLTVLEGKFPITAPDIAANAVEANAILAGAVITEKLIAGAVVTEKLFAGAVTADKVFTNTLTANEINANAITASELNAGSVVAEKVFTNTLTALQINTGAITTDELFTGAVTALKVATDTLTSNEINAGAITTSELTSECVYAINVRTDTLTANQINTNAITTAELSTESVYAVDVKADTLTANEINTGAITATELATDSVTSVKIFTGAVTTEKIFAGAVVADKIAAGAVTTSKLTVGGLSDELIKDGNFQDELVDNDWVAGGTPTPYIAVSANYPGGRSGIIQSVNSTYGNLRSNFFPVTYGDDYAFSANVSYSGQAPNGLLMRINYYNSSKGLLGSSDVNFSPGSGANQYGASTSRRWVVTRTWTPPSTAKWATVQLFNYPANTSATTSTIYLNDVSAKRQIQGSLLVNGAIDGQTITGASIQTSTSATVGVKLNDTDGIVAYGGGVPKVQIRPTGNATFMGEIGTAPPGSIGTFIYSTTFSGAGAQQPNPIIQLNVAATRDQPSIQGRGGEPGIRIYSGANTSQRESIGLWENNKILMGIESGADDQIYDGAHIWLQRDLISLKAENVGTSSQIGRIQVLSNVSFLGYDIIGGGFQGYRHSVGNPGRVHGVGGMEVVDPGGSNWRAVKASAFNTASDRRLKKNISVPAVSALNTLRSAPTYEWESVLSEDDFVPNKRRIGPMSEDLPSNVIDVVRTGEDFEHFADGMDTVDLHQMLAVLWKAVQELDVELDKVPGLRTPGVTRKQPKLTA